jgi:hypothetical protein
MSENPHGRFQNANAVAMLLFVAGAPHQVQAFPSGDARATRLLFG